MPVAPVHPDEERRIDALKTLQLYGTGPEDRFDRLAEKARKTFGVPIVMIDFVKEKDVWIKSVVGLELQEAPRDASYCQWTLLQKSVCYIPDAQTDARVADLPWSGKLRFYVGSPLLFQCLPVGTMCICDYVPRTLSAEQVNEFLDLVGEVETELTR